jgi:hypothetical protein
MPLLSAAPFIGVLPSSSESIIGFELLPDARLFAKTSSVSPLSLVDSLWASGIRAFDLRFIRTESSQAMRIYLLCRIQPPITNDKHVLHKYCQGAARYVQRLFDRSGYKLQLLTQESTLNFVRQPFHFQTVAEIRRAEEIQVFSQDYADVEFYATYPWEWYYTGEIPYFDTLQQQQGNWLVSMYLEPTRLSILEERFLDRAASSANVDVLLSGGMKGETIRQAYTDLTRRLNRPHLLRINVTATNQKALTQIGQVFLRPWQTTMPNPVLQYTSHPYEHQAAERNIVNLEWLPWGSVRDNEPNSARLRYLTDSKGASIIFHLPIPQTRIKVLVVLANPSGTGPLRLQREERLIKEVTRSSRVRDNLEDLTILPAKTIHDLGRALGENEYHVVHIAAHGNRDGFLTLEDELGNPTHISQKRLALLFKTYSATSVRCVLLNACRGLDLTRFWRGPKRGSWVMEVHQKR